MWVREQPILDTQTATDRRQQTENLARALADIDKRINNLLRTLELADDITPDLIRDIHTRRATLTAERTTIQESIATLEDAAMQEPNPALLDALPSGGSLDVATLPEHTARHPFEAFRLEIHYDRRSNIATYRATIAAETLSTARHALMAATSADAADEDPSQLQDTTAPMLAIPRTHPNPTPRRSAQVSVVSSPPAGPPEAPQPSAGDTPSTPGLTPFPPAPNIHPTTPA